MFLHALGSVVIDVIIPAYNEEGSIGRLALTHVLDSSPDPLTQLENMLYAVVDCGAKYSFFHKLHTQP